MASEQETSLENLLLNSYKSELIAYIESHPEDFAELVELAVSDKQPYSWRAAWLLWSCMANNDKRLHKHIKKIIEILAYRNDNQQRELLMILQRMDISTAFEGRLFDLCINIWTNINKNPSLRFNAFKIMCAISKKYPELTNELKIMTDECYTGNLSENVKKSIYKILTIGKR